MDVDDKIALIKQNVVEVVTDEELANLLKTKKKPIVYCGYEPSGPMHLGHFVTVIKLMDFAKAGFKVKFLLADIHALLNRKGQEDKIAKDVDAWRKTVKAIGLDAEIVLGSDFEFTKEYVSDVMSMAQEITINRGLRSMQEIARDIENATVSQLWYPLMQIADIKYLKCDVAYGGMEQRKIHMAGRELKDVLGHSFIAVHTPLITSLKGPGQKMSKSIPGSGISVVDSDEEITKIIKNAYCPEKIVQDNPMLQISKLIIFPLRKKISIKRLDKFGGNIEFKNYEELEKTYLEGKLHPLDLKNCITVELIEIITPIRKLYNK
ncbi:MAG: tyrosine--tRNA ligase [Nanoarchaeota archaeon]|nr:tyrosine--tRNA ligase [Nanoarchaeota archaeon]MBU4124442.1 tyrosine--tRNA ligase [Nanoarchaeota archaeon]